MLKIGKNNRNELSNVMIFTSVEEANNYISDSVFNKSFAYRDVNFVLTDNVDISKADIDYLKEKLPKTKQVLLSSSIEEDLKADGKLNDVKNLFSGNEIKTFCYSQMKGSSKEVEKKYEKIYVVDGDAFESRKVQIIDFNDEKVGVICVKTSLLEMRGVSHEELKFGVLDKILQAAVLNEVEIKLDNKDFSNSLIEIISAGCGRNMTIISDGVEYKINNHIESLDMYEKELNRINVSDLNDVTVGRINHRQDLFEIIDCRQEVSNSSEMVFLISVQKKGEHDIEVFSFSEKDSIMELSDEIEEKLGIKINIASLLSDSYLIDGKITEDIVEVVKRVHISGEASEELTGLIFNAINLYSEGKDFSDNDRKTINTLYKELEIENRAEKHTGVSNLVKCGMLSELQELRKSTGLIGSDEENALKETELVKNSVNEVFKDMGIDLVHISPADGESKYDVSVSFNDNIYNYYDLSDVEAIIKVVKNEVLRPEKISKTLEEKGYEVKGVANTDETYIAVAEKEGVSEKLVVLDGDIGNASLTEKIENKNEEEMGKIELQGESKDKKEYTMYYGLKKANAGVEDIKERISTSGKGFILTGNREKAIKFAGDKGTLLTLKGEFNLAETKEDVKKINNKYNEIKKSGISEESTKMYARAMEECGYEGKATLLSDQTLEYMLLDKSSLVVVDETVMEEIKEKEEKKEIVEDKAEENLSIDGLKMSVIEEREEFTELFNEIRTDERLIEKAKKESFEIYKVSLTTEIIEQIEVKYNDNPIECEELLSEVKVRVELVAAELYLSQQNESAKNEASLENEQDSGKEKVLPRKLTEMEKRELPPWKNGQLFKGETKCIESFKEGDIVVNAFKGSLFEVNKLGIEEKNGKGIDTYAELRSLSDGSLSREIYGSSGVGRAIFVANETTEDAAVEEILEKNETEKSPQQEEVSNTELNTVEEKTNIAVKEEYSLKEESVCIEARNIQTEDKKDIIEEYLPESEIEKKLSTLFKSGNINGVVKTKGEATLDISVNQNSLILKHTITSNRIAVQTNYVYCKIVGGNIKFEEALIRNTFFGEITVTDEAKVLTILEGITRFSDDVDIPAKLSETFAKNEEKIMEESPITAKIKDILTKLDIINEIDTETEKRFVISTPSMKNIELEIVAGKNTLRIEYKSKSLSLFDNSGYYMEFKKEGNEYVYSTGNISIPGKLSLAEAVVGKLEEIEEKGLVNPNVNIKVSETTKIEKGIIEKYEEKVIDLLVNDKDVLRAVNVNPRSDYNHSFRTTDFKGVINDLLVAAMKCNDVEKSEFLQFYKLAVDDKGYAIELQNKILDFLYSQKDEKMDISKAVGEAEEYSNENKVQVKDTYSIEKFLFDFSLTKNELNADTISKGVFNYHTNGKSKITDNEIEKALTKAVKGGAGFDKLRALIPKEYPGMLNFIASGFGFQTTYSFLEYLNNPNVEVLETYLNDIKHYESEINKEDLSISKSKAARYELALAKQHSMIFLKEKPSIGEQIQYFSGYNTEYLKFIFEIKSESLMPLISEAEFSAEVKDKVNTFLSKHDIKSFRSELAYNANVANGRGNYTFLKIVDGVVELHTPLTTLDGKDVIVRDNNFEVVLEGLKKENQICRELLDEDKVEKKAIEILVDKENPEQLVLKYWKRDYSGYSQATREEIKSLEIDKAKLEGEMLTKLTNALDSLLKENKIPKQNGRLSFSYPRINYRDNTFSVGEAHNGRAYGTGGSSGKTYPIPVTESDYRYIAMNNVTAEAQLLINPEFREKREHEYFNKISSFLSENYPTIKINSIEFEKVKQGNIVKSGFSIELSNIEQGNSQTFTLIHGINTVSQVEGFINELAVGKKEIVEHRETKENRASLLAEEIFGTDKAVLKEINKELNLDSKLIKKIASGKIDDEDEIVEVTDLIKDSLMHLTEEGLNRVEAVLYNIEGEEKSNEVHSIEVTEEKSNSLSARDIISDLKAEISSDNAREYKKILKSEAFVEKNEALANKIAEYISKDVKTDKPDINQKGYFVYCTEGLEAVLAKEISNKNNFSEVSKKIDELISFCHKVKTDKEYTKAFCTEYGITEPLTFNLFAQAEQSMAEMEPEIQVKETFVQVCSNEKVTIYLKSDVMGSIMKYEGTLQEYGKRPYAQHEAIPFVSFMPAGSKRPVEFIQTSNPYMLIVKGWGQITPESTIKIETEVKGVVITKSKYRSFDKRFITDFNDLINPLIASGKVEVISDFRAITTGNMEKTKEKVKDYLTELLIITPSEIGETELAEKLQDEVFIESIGKEIIEYAREEGIIFEKPEEGLEFAEEYISAFFERPYIEHTWSKTGIKIFEEFAENYIVDYICSKAEDILVSVTPDLGNNSYSKVISDFKAEYKNAIYSSFQDYADKVKGKEEVYNKHIESILGDEKILDSRIHNVYFTNIGNEKHNIVDKAIKLVRTKIKEVGIDSVKDLLPTESVTEYKAIESDTNSVKGSAAVKDSTLKLENFVQFKIIEPLRKELLGKDITELERKLADLAMGDKQDVQEKQNIEIETVPKVESVKVSVEDKMLIDSYAQSKQGKTYRKLDELLGGNLSKLNNSEFFCFKIKPDNGLMPLVVEKTGTNRIELSHTYVQNGDLMYDTCLEIEINPKQHTAESVSWVNPVNQYRLEMFTYDENGKKNGIRKIKNDTDTFLKDFINEKLISGFSFDVKSIEVLEISEDLKELFTSEEKIEAIYESIDQKKVEPAGNITKEEQESISEKSVKTKIHEIMDLRKDLGHRADTLGIIEKEDFIEKVVVYLADNYSENKDLYTNKILIDSAVEVIKGEMGVSEPDRAEINPIPLTRDKGIRSITQDKSDEEKSYLTASKRVAANERAREIISNYDGSELTDEELTDLDNYTGDGGLLDKFTEDDEAEINDLTEFYTDSARTEFIWDIAQHLGLSEGMHILEPSCGTGNFIKTAPNGINVVGVELDKTSSDIAKLKFPEALIQNCPAEVFFKKDTMKFDFTVGNPPFIKKYHKHIDGAKYDRTENYFIDKQVEKVKEGGYVINILPSTIIDGTGEYEKTRRNLVSEGKVVGVVRFGKDTFSHSNTAVNTDIVIFRKDNPYPKLKAVKERVLELVKDGGDVSSYLKDVLASYKADHDKLYINGEVIDTTPYNVKDDRALETNIIPGFKLKKTGNSVEIELKEGKNTYKGDVKVDYAEDLAEIGKNHPTEALKISKFNEDFLEGKLKKECEIVGKFPIFNVEKGVLSKEEFYKELPNMLKGISNEIKEMAEASPIVYKYEKKIETVPHSASEVLSEETFKISKGEIKEGFAKIVNGKEYILYNGKWNNASETEKLYIGKMTSILNSVAESIEMKNKGFETRGIENYIKGEITKFESKLPEENLFKNPIVGKYLDDANIKNKSILIGKLSELRETINTVDLNEYIIGRDELGDIVDTFVVDKLQNKDALYEMQGKVYIRDSIFSKNVIEKIDYINETMETLKQDEKLSPELQTKYLEIKGGLEKELTDKKIPLSKIMFDLNTKFIPQEIKLDFIEKYIFNRGYSDKCRNSVKIRPEANNKGTIKYRIDVSEGMSWDNKDRARDLEGILNFSDFRGENDKKIAEHEIEASVDMLRTTNYKIKEIDAAFKMFVEENPAYGELIEAKFNREFNSFNKETSVNHGDFYIPGIKESFSFKPHQIEGITRVYQNHGGILAHQVGAGKTASGVALAIKNMNNEKIGKVCIIAPKNKVLDWKAEFSKVFEDKVLDGNIFAVRKNNKEGVEALKQFCLAEKGILIISYENFQKISLSPDELEKSINSYVDITVRDVTENKLTAKTIKDKTRKKEDKRDTILAAYVDDEDGADSISNVTFEMTGIKCLIPDEAHKYKNLIESDKSLEVYGIKPSSGSLRAKDFFFKTDYLQREYGASNTYLLTATPFTTKPDEIYTMATYYDRKAFKGVHNVYDFVETFIQGKTDVVFTYDLEYRSKIFTNFVRVDTLRDSLKGFAHYVNRLKGVKVPHYVISNVEVKASSLMEAEYSKLKDKLAEADPKEALSIYSEFVAVAKDLGLKNPDYKNYCGNKIKSLCDIVKKEHTSDPDGTQLIFTDRVSYSYGEEGEFTQKIKKALMKEVGYQDEEVFCITSKTEIEKDRKGLIGKLIEENKPKEALLEAFDQYKAGTLSLTLEEAKELYNMGKIKIMIGTTQRMGEGLNLQKRTTAIHNFNIPYLSEELLQRLGRAVRQGNDKDLVNIYNYLQDNSTDKYIETLARMRENWLKELFQGKDSVINADDNGVNIKIMKLELDSAIAKGLKKETIEREKDLVSRENDERKLTPVKMSMNSYEEIIAGVRKEQTSKDYNIFIKKEYENAKEIILSAVKSLESLDSDLFKVKEVVSEIREKHDKKEVSLMLDISKSKMTPEFIRNMDNNLDKIQDKDLVKFLSSGPKERVKMFLNDAAKIKELGESTKEKVREIIKAIEGTYNKNAVDLDTDQILRIFSSPIDFHGGEVKDNLPTLKDITLKRVTKVLELAQNSTPDLYNLRSAFILALNEVEKISKGKTLSTLAIKDLDHYINMREARIGISDKTINVLKTRLNNNIQREDISSIADPIGKNALISTIERAKAIVLSGEKTNAYYYDKERGQTLEKGELFILRNKTHGISIASLDKMETGRATAEFTVKNEFSYLGKGYNDNSINSINIAGTRSIESNIYSGITRKDKPLVPIKILPEAIRPKVENMISITKELKLINDTLYGFKHGNYSVATAEDALERVIGKGRSESKNIELFTILATEIINKIDNVSVEDVLVEKVAGHTLAKGMEAIVNLIESLDVSMPREDIEKSIKSACKTFYFSRVEKDEMTLKSFSEKIVESILENKTGFSLKEYNNVLAEVKIYFEKISEEMKAEIDIVEKIKNAEWTEIYKDIPSVKDNQITDDDISKLKEVKDENALIYVPIFKESIRSEKYMVPMENLFSPEIIKSGKYIVWDNSIYKNDKDFLINFRDKAFQVISDRSNNGFETFKDLLNMGKYQVYKEALNLLPESIITYLKTMKAKYPDNYKDMVLSGTEKLAHIKKQLLGNTHDNIVCYLAYANFLKNEIAEKEFEKDNRTKALEESRDEIPVEKQIQLISEIEDIISDMENEYDQTITDLMIKINDISEDKQLVEDLLLGVVIVNIDSEKIEKVNHISIYKDVEDFKVKVEYSIDIKTETVDGAEHKISERKELNYSCETIEDVIQTSQNVDQDISLRDIEDDTYYEKKVIQDSRELIDEMDI